MGTVTIKYSRRRTDKGMDGSFDSAEIGGEIAVDELDTDGDPLKVWEAVFTDLKAQVESKLSEVFATSTVVQAMDAVPARPETWVEKTVRESTDAIQQKMLPGESLSGTGAAGQDEYGTPDAALLKGMAENNMALHFEGCRVFDANNGTGSMKGKVVNLRVGKRGPDGIPGQYITTESWANDDTYEDAKAIREGDYVDIWGYLKPWKTDPNRFSLVIQKIERVPQNG